MKIKYDYSELKLKQDFEEKPFIILPNHLIFVETFHSCSEISEDFLSCISEPLSRTEYIHEYQITEYSLYAGASLGITYIEMIQILDRFSKLELENDIKEFIKKWTVHYGKIKLRLVDNVFHLLCKDEEILKRMNWNENQIIQDQEIEETKKKCIEMNCPILEEYDFRRDKSSNLKIELKSNVHIRHYQEKCLERIFMNGLARSGIIVLPCGAGKTLVGITTTCTISRNTIILCNSVVSVEQWYREFLKYSNIPESNLVKFNSELKENCVVITTYSMITFNGKRSEKGTEFLKQLKQREWGLLIFDEVHVAPADTFRKVIHIIKSHCKIGLTATLVREDEKTLDLNFLIGPKLYEANWLELEAQGYLSKVECFQVDCPMTAEYYKEYLLTKKNLFSIMNPNKFRSCEYLIHYHLEKGDKIIVFSDHLFPLIEYSKMLNFPLIYGSTSHKDRLRILNEFQNQLNCVFISKVGDTSIDIPSCNVIIQISSQFGSRRQEAQRLGRILRPKGNSKNISYFYTLISKDTSESYFNIKRQIFLMNQGYSYKIIELKNFESNKLFKSKSEEINYLNKIKVIHDDHLEDEEIIGMKRTNKLSNLSNLDETMYIEYEEKEKKKVKNLLKNFLN